MGTVPNARIPDYLVKSHLLVVPSHYEALGIAYLEAMRFELSMIATTAWGAHEIVGHGREGFLVAPGDADALTRHLRLLIADRELLLRMGLAARRRATSHPRWDQSFERARAPWSKPTGVRNPGRRSLDHPQAAQQLALLPRSLREKGVLKFLYFDVMPLACRDQRVEDHLLLVCRYVEAPHLRLGPRAPGRVPPP